jgi:hypothetical protein
VRGHEVKLVYTSNRGLLRLLWWMLMMVLMVFMMVISELPGLPLPVPSSGSDGRPASHSSPRQPVTVAAVPDIPDASDELSDSRNPDVSFEHDEDGDNLDRSIAESVDSVIKHPMPHGVAWGGDVVSEPTPVIATVPSAPPATSDHGRAYASASTRPEALANRAGDRDHEPALESRPYQEARVTEHGHSRQHDHEHHHHHHHHHHHERPHTAGAAVAASSAPVSAWSERKADQRADTESFDAVLRAADSRHRMAVSSGTGGPAIKTRERGWSSASSDGSVGNRDDDVDAVFLNHRRVPDEEEVLAMLVEPIGMRKISVGAHVGTGVDFVVGGPNRNHLSQTQPALRVKQPQVVLTGTDDPMPWTTVGYVDQTAHDLDIDWNAVQPGKDVAPKRGCVPMSWLA